jgi:hypothetical protein
VRLKAKTRGSKSLSHTRWSGGREYLEREEDRRRDTSFGEFIQNKKRVKVRGENVTLEL